MLTKKEQPINNNFYCELCDFACSKKSNYDRHLSTKKHLNASNCLQNKCDIEQTIFKCSCGLVYKHRQSLSTHKKKCKIINAVISEELIPPEESKNELKVLTNLVLEVLKQNNELQKQNNELQKQMSVSCKETTINNTHTNSHNKTFNLNFFLNEQCKDAMNLSEFVNKIHLKLSDLENVGKLGYVEGISQIIINQLNDTDMYKRPMHCSDVKREVLYIKDDNKWEKDDPNNTKIKKVVKEVEKKNMGLITDWTCHHPHHKESTSHENDTYLKLIIASTDGDEDNVSNVIKKITKNVAIDKDIKDNRIIS